VRFKIVNPSKENEISVGQVIIYDDKPVNGILYNESAAKK
jgi:hypothetical protein